MSGESSRNTSVCSSSSEDKPPTPNNDLDNAEYSYKQHNHQNKIKSDKVNGTSPACIGL